MKQFFLYIAVGLSLGLPAQDIKYDTASVPAAVRKNADVIKRYENIVFEVNDIDRASLKVHQVFTVLNENGKPVLGFHQPVSPFVKLDDANIKVYDASGKQLQKYKRKDLLTTAIGDGLVDDGKMVFLFIPATSYPVTVEYEYEVKYKGTLHYPNYEILLPRQGVEQSSFTAKVPKDIGLRYQEKNIKLTPVITEDGNYKVYQWTARNLPPVEYEEGSVSYESRYPSVTLAPNRFKMDDYEGDMSSWKNFGKWYGGLKQGIDVLPDERKSFFIELVKDAADEREKVRRIYDYLQKNFRYVSIQLGIGGYKPFPADFTDKKKYGDCKALSNYMQACLDAVGVQSYQALMNAAHNSEPVDPTFPCNRFNHVILCVPQKKDSIWLECTSKTIDFGVLGSGTENKLALLITKDGGVLAPTPVSRAEDNIFQAATVIELDEDGRGKTNTVFTTTGEYRYDMNNILDEKEDEQKKSIVYGLGFKQPDQFVFAKKEANHAFTTSLEMNIEKIPEFAAGNKLFIAPRIYKLWKNKLPKSENRTQDFYFYHPFKKTDTTIIKLPAGFSPDVLPKPKQLSCAYATYSTAYWLDDTQKAIYSIATLLLKQHKIPVAHYAEVKKFFDDVMMDEAQRIVVRR